jgi:hypothetical protein
MSVQMLELAGLLCVTASLTGLFYRALQSLARIRRELRSRNGSPA